MNVNIACQDGDITRLNELIISIEKESFHQIINKVVIRIIWEEHLFL